MKEGSIKQQSDIYWLTKQKPKNCKNSWNEGTSKDCRETVLDRERRECNFYNINEWVCKIKQFKWTYQQNSKTSKDSAWLAIKDGVTV